MSTFNLRGGSFENTPRDSKIFFNESTTSSEASIYPESPSLAYRQGLDTSGSSSSSSLVYRHLDNSNRYLDSSNQSISPYEEEIRKTTKIVGGVPLLLKREVKGKVFLEVARESLTEKATVAYAYIWPIFEKVLLSREQIQVGTNEIFIKQCKPLRFPETRVEKLTPLPEAFEEQLRKHWDLLRLHFQKLEQSNRSIEGDEKEMTHRRDVSFNNSLVSSLEKFHLTVLEQWDELMDAVVKQDHIKLEKLMTQRVLELNQFYAPVGMSLLMSTLYNWHAQGGIGARMATLLLKNRANVNQQSLFDGNAVTLSAEKENFDALDFFLKKGGSPNVPNSLGYTPLHLAVIKGNEEMVVRLLKVPGFLNLEVETNEGDTPLMKAAQKGYFEIVKQLVAAGAKKSFINFFHHYTAYDLAIIEKNKTDDPKKKSDYQKIIDFLKPEPEQPLPKQYCQSKCPKCAIL